MYLTWIKASGTLRVARNNAYTITREGHGAWRVRDGHGIKLALRPSEMDAKLWAQAHADGALDSRKAG